MNAIVTRDPQRIDVGLAVIRVIVGLVFIAHGCQKLFMMGLGPVTAGFTQMGIPLPAITAPLVVFVELLGGIALVLGLLTRLAALGLAIDMVGAILLVHLKNGFFLPTGFEFPLLLLVICIAIMIAGPGRFAIDDAIAARRRPVTAP